MLIVMLGLLLQDGSEWRPGPHDPHQSSMDADAERMASRLDPDVADERGEVLTTPRSLPRMRSTWRPVTDEEMRHRSGYYAPPGYRFRRSARTDFDRDGRLDRIEMVESGRQRALRITYAAAGKAPRIVSRGTGTWIDQGLFPVGRHAVMVNHPESSVVILFERASVMRAVFLGD